MDPMLALVLLGVIILCLLVLGTPIAVALGLTGAIGLWMYGGAKALHLIASNLYGQMTSFVLVAVPLFLLMGVILEKGRVGTYLSKLANSWLGWMPAGLAFSTVVACAMASALAGASIAVVAAVGPGAMSEMRKEGYHARVAAGVVCAAGGLGILIPPSIPLIFYGMLAEVSVGKLFMGGIMPGILLVIFYGIALTLWRKIAPNMVPRVAQVSWRVRGKASLLALPAGAVAGFVFGSIYGGIATPTEASAIGAAGMFIVAGLVYRQLSVKTSKDCLIRGAEVSVMVGFLLAGGITFACAISALRVPWAIRDTMLAMNLSPILFILIVNLVGLILGMFVDVLSLLIILAPLTVPIIMAMGYDPVWWGVVLVMNGEIAVATPPVGLNLYVAQGISGIPLGDIIKGVLPLLMCDIAVLVLIILFPDIVLFLPGIMK